MDHRVGPPLLEGTGGLERRLDGTDPAAEGVVPAKERELALGGGDDEHHGADRISGKARRVGRSWPSAWGSRSRSTPRLGGRGGSRSSDLLEPDLPVLGVHADRVAVGEIALEQA